jgi:hypothetical protein
VARVGALLAVLLGCRAQIISPTDEAAHGSSADGGVPVGGTGRDGGVQDAGAPSIDVGPGRGEVWVAAAPSLRFHDGIWEDLGVPTIAGAFWGSSARDVWAAGFASDAILRRQGE